MILQRIRATEALIWSGATILWRPPPSGQVEPPFRRTVVRCVEARAVVQQDDARVEAQLIHARSMAQQDDAHAGRLHIVMKRNRRCMRSTRERGRSRTVYTQWFSTSMRTRRYGRSTRPGPVLNLHHPA